VRHGATSNNLRKPSRLQGRRENPPLSEQGYRQAEQTGQLMADYPLTTVYSSPLLRAIETARAIAQPHGLHVQTVEALTEVDVGEWDGRDWGEIERDDAEAYRLFMADPATHGYLGGETFQQVQDRVAPAFESLMARHIGQCIAVAAHNIVNRTYLARLLDIPTRHARLISQHNCGVNVIRHRQGKATLRTCNSAFHLAGA
jgi:alpha-ribazole phosphatase